MSKSNDCPHFANEDTEAQAVKLLAQGHPARKGDAGCQTRPTWLQSSCPFLFRKV